MMFQCSHNFSRHPGILLFPPDKAQPLQPHSVTAGSASRYLLTAYRSECHWIQASSIPLIRILRHFNLQCIILQGTWFWFWTRERERTWHRGSWKRGREAKRVFKAVIIHWKSLVNMQYPLQFILSGDRKWTTREQRPTVIKSSSSIWSVSNWDYLM